MKLRAELSRKNKYWIHKHRYYELKHFCLQYKYWEKIYNSLSSNVSKPYIPIYKGSMVSDPTARLAEHRLLYFEKMSLVKRTAAEADPYLARYIFKAVTEGLSYVNLSTKYEMPCARDMYYDRYRKFFWLLDKERN